MKNKLHSLYAFTSYFKNEIWKLKSR